MHRFLEDLQRRMQSKAVHGEKEPLKLAVYSTREYTPVLALGLRRGRSDLTFSSSVLPRSCSLDDTALAGLLSTLDSFDFR